MSQRLPHSVYELSTPLLILNVVDTRDVVELEDLDMYRNSKVVANYVRQIGRAALQPYHAAAVAGFARCRLPNATDSCSGLFLWHPKYSAKYVDPCSVEGIRHFHVGSDLQAAGAPEKAPVMSSTGTPLLPPARGKQKPRVVILGSGWGACRLLKDIDTLVYDVVCVSPRNHMVFTPLLASTCVGTLEFRSVAEPVRKIQPALSLSPDSFYLPARCTAIDPEKHEVHFIAVLDDMATGKTGTEFTVAYDKLVIATGAEASTFGIKGVTEYAIFLRDVKNARDIRTKLLLNLMLCEIPGRTAEEKQRLSHIVVVGGGPTGVELSGELSDFIRGDVHRNFGHVKSFIRVTLVEANELLASFDVRLREYATNHLIASGVDLVRGIVKEVKQKKLVLTDGTELAYGLLVWSTGVGASTFVKGLSFPKSPGGRIGVDLHLRVPSLPDVYAIGDCAGYLEETKKPVLPALAQVAERQGKYIAKALNSLEPARCRAGKATEKPPPTEEPFVYKHLGSMATIGRYKALVDLRENKDTRGISITGFISWLIWRSAYLTRVMSWRNRLYVMVNWAITLAFGRDDSRF